MAIISNFPYPVEDTELSGAAINGDNRSIYQLNISSGSVGTMNVSSAFWVLTPTLVSIHVNDLINSSLILYPNKFYSMGGIGKYNGEYEVWIIEGLPQDLSNWVLFSGEEPVVLFNYTIPGASSVLYLIIE